MNPEYAKALQLLGQVVINNNNLVEQINQMHARMKAYEQKIKELEEANCPKPCCDPVQLKVVEPPDVMN